MLRLLSTPDNSATGEAADPTARGFWKDEAFHLETRLDRESLLRFFLEDYAPSPIVAPWNAGSGFYFQERKSSEKDPTTGKKIKTGVRDQETQATRRISALSATEAPRLERLARAMRDVRALLDALGADRAPSETEKVALMERLRAMPDDSIADWLDAAVALTGDEFDPAALLGSGGNDGNLEFSGAFHRALMSLIDPTTGLAPSTNGAGLSLALFGQAGMVGETNGLSQFSPGRIAAPNATTGFSGDGGEDAWSIIFLVEGSLAFAGTVTRRGEAHRPRGSFPFTVSHRGTGSGAVVLADEDSNRSREIWLPLWTRPALYPELRALFAEGRAHIGERAARDGLSFARAVAALGVNRGLDAFERVGFEARYGNMFITAPLGRFHTPRPGQASDDFIADLDRGDWLARVRSMARDTTAPARATTAFRRLEDALFLMTSANRREDGARAALIALGDVVAWMVSSKEARDKLSPPPRLRSAWVQEADDRSAEFRIAAALASLGWGDTRTGPPSEATLGANGDGADHVSEVTSDAPARDHPPRRLPMAAHFAPLDLSVADQPWWRWNDDRPAGERSAEPLAVWGAGGLVRNMVAVLDRRLIEQAMRGLEDKPLAAAAPARLSDVLAFLTDRGFDDTRCARLLAGLVWAKPARLKVDQRERQHPPFAYAALKPLFTPDAALRAETILPDGARLPVPPGLIARLRTGETDAAVRSALARARASGLASPFDPARLGDTKTCFGAGLEGDRLAAALLIPLRSRDLRTLIDIAYPDPTAANPSEETTDAA
ncbi:CRISPR-associated protein Csx17 [Roseospira goensis]|uniref:CRISPR-associated protein Csx17 n=1 Tax=Roseospira goensis TaxID=391922 RepID=A0A7W6S0T8_9PROT|nr:CRISPR-associated protein Csx17 [Roseospira goensis]